MSNDQSEPELRYTLPAHRLFVKSSRDPLPFLALPISFDQTKLFLLVLCSFSLSFSRSLYFLSKPRKRLNCGEAEAGFGLCQNTNFFPLHFRSDNLCVVVLVPLDCDAPSPFGHCISHLASRVKQLYIIMACSSDGNSDHVDVATFSFFIFDQIVWKSALGNRCGAISALQQSCNNRRHGRYYIFRI